MSLRAAVLWAGLAATCVAPLRAQIPTGREALERIHAPPLRFSPPVPRRYDVAGVPVFHLEDPALPLVDVFVTVRGGYARFGRQRYAAGTALPSLLRYGGTWRLPPDSVEALIETFALQMSFGGEGETVFAGVNALARHAATGVDLLMEMLASPRFDRRQVEVWRGRELENVRRRADDPGRLAFSEFNRLLYGDHPIGWEMEEADLSPERLTDAVLRDLHRRIVCREHLVVGVTGRVTWEEARAMVERAVLRVPPCGEPLPPPPVPSIRRASGVFLIPRPVAQSVIVMAHPTPVHLADDPEYFAAQIANSILGGGGFSSRMLARVRTEEGLAYSAATLWTTPRRWDGIIGALTRTRPESTAEAVRVVLDVLEDATRSEPSPDELRTAVERVVNGFVFNFESPARIVARRMSYLIQDLPDDWLERYVDGIRAVDPAAVRDVLARHLHPERMTILVVGDPERMDMEGLRALGPVTVLPDPSAR